MNSQARERLIRRLKKLEVKCVWHIEKGHLLPEHINEWRQHADAVRSAISELEIVNGLRKNPPIGRGNMQIGETE